jgi:hypothetical protein
MMDNLNTRSSSGVRHLYCTLPLYSKIGLLERFRIGRRGRELD